MYGVKHPCSPLKGTIIPPLKGRGIVKVTIIPPMPALSAAEVKRLPARRGDVLHHYKSQAFLDRRKTEEKNDIPFHNSLGVNS